MGLLSVVSRVGAAAAPFVVQLSRINPILPFGLMGGLTFFAAFVCWFLPETKGKPTLEVIGDDKVHPPTGKFKIITSKAWSSLAT